MLKLVFRTQLGLVLRYRPIVPATEKLKQEDKW